MLHISCTQHNTNMGPTANRPFPSGENATMVGTDPGNNQSSPVLEIRNSAEEELKELRATVARLLRDNAVAEEARAVAEERARIAENCPERAKMLKDIATMRVVAREEGRELYYANQQLTADAVVECIKSNDIVFQMVLAEMQAGKTGCMLAIIESLVESRTIAPDNIFIITGLSDKEWESQTRDRVPLGANVIHRGQLTKSKSRFENLKNAVLLVDECQLASKEKMTIDKMFDGMGLKDLEYLKANNINIVEFSATPNGTLSDIEMWKDCSKTHVMKPGVGYKGAKDLINDNRIFEAEDLYVDDDPSPGWSQERQDARNVKIQPAKDAIQNVKEKIEQYADTRFHIFRIPFSDKGDTVIGRIQSGFGVGYEFKKCFKNNDTSGEDQRLLAELKNIIPKKPTILFIKESARCASTYPNKFRIGVNYGRMACKTNDDTINQAEPGRAMGYDVDDGMIVYTNIDSVKRYIAMVDSGFTEREGFTYFGHKRDKPTHLRPSGYTGVDEIDAQTPPDTVTVDRPVVEFSEFITYAEARAWWCTHIRSRAVEGTDAYCKLKGPQDPTRRNNARDENGFYRYNSVVSNRTMIERKFRRGVGSRNTSGQSLTDFRLAPVYGDLGDPATLRWLLAYNPMPETTA